MSGIVLGTSATIGGPIWVGLLLGIILSILAKKYGQEVDFEQVAKYAVWETKPPADGEGRSFGGPVLYAAIHTNQSLFVRRGDLLVRYKLK